MDKLLKKLGLRWRDWETYGVGVKQGWILLTWWNFVGWWRGNRPKDRLRDLKKQAKKIRERTEHEMQTATYIQ